MKKVLDFLESYVQWIALAAGALFLGYCIYTYVLQTPVMVTGIPNSGPLNPGEVDNTILNGPAHRLDLSMHDTTIPPMVVPHFVKTFITQLKEVDFDAKELAVIWNSQTVVPPDVGGPVNPTQQAPPINALPTIAAATVLDFSTGRSNVQIAGAAPAAVPGAAAVQPVMGGADKSWVTVRYSISPKQLAAAFDAANIPPWTDRTAILQVNLYRQEMLPNGQWGPAELVPPLNADALNTYPNVNLQAEQDYLAWAPAHAGDLMQPAFLQVNRGDPWVLPGQVAAVPVGLPPLDPKQDYPDSVKLQYNIADRQAYQQQHTAYLQSQQPSKNRRPTNNGQGSGGSNPRGVVEDPERERAEASAPFLAPPPPADQDQRNLAQPTPQPTTPPIFGDPSNPAAPAAAPAAGQPPAMLLPPNEFDPKQIVGDLIGWQHDISVEPGHTYRYMVVYKVKSPVFNTSAVKNNPALAKVFDLTSPASNWTQPVSIVTSTNFFVASNSAPGASVARFKVFKWENGAEREHDFDVTPGDVIGTKEAVGDFSTGWTLVALRFDDPHNSGAMTAIVMGPDGQIAQRDYRTDLARPELQNLINQVSQAAAAASAANTGGSNGAGG